MLAQHIYPRTCFPLPSRLVVDRPDTSLNYRIIIFVQVCASRDANICRSMKMLLEMITFSTQLSPYTVVGSPQVVNLHGVHTAGVGDGSNGCLVLGSL
jgi:hypothetical protein